MPGWDGSTRKETLPPDWERRRAHVLRRDGYRCQHIRYDTNLKCGRRATDCDHIGDRLDHSYENLQALCRWHHNRKSGSQGGAASASARAERESRPFTHPGVLP